MSHWKANCSGAMEEVKKPGEAAEECSVCVAVNIRPLVDIEIVEGCQESLTVSAQHAQVLFQFINKIKNKFRLDVVENLFYLIKYMAIAVAIIQTIYLKIVLNH